MLFMAAFSDLVTTFQPKHGQITLEIVFVKLNKVLKDVKFIGLFELQRLHCYPALIKILGLLQ